MHLVRRAATFLTLATLAGLACSSDPDFHHSTPSTVHPAGIADPDSQDSHGRLLRAMRWAPMLDAKNPQACGGCHDGSPSRPKDVLLVMPGATPCTQCHDKPAGVLACDTCHGSGDRAYPPRDPAMLTDDLARAGAHAAHVEPSRSRFTGLPCSTCHPVPGATVIEGQHGNGNVDVKFDSSVSAEATFDRTTRTCAVRCHDRGGSIPRPSWDSTVAMRCGDCHASPPAPHSPGACSSCHRETDATGTSLAPGVLHLNGRTDLGDGSRQCGACHGRGSDPWPRSGAHQAHRRPTSTTPIDCTDCHADGDGIVRPGHFDGAIELAFSGRAVARGARPSWDGQRCSSVACHGEALHDAPSTAPEWTDGSGRARACDGCHGAPPSQHDASESCDRSTCHGGEVARDVFGVLTITPAGRSLHMNGVVDSNGPQ